MRLPLDVAVLPHAWTAIGCFIAGLLVSRLRLLTASSEIIRLGVSEQVPFAQSVSHGSTIYLAGVTANADKENGPIHESDTVEEQTMRTLRVIDERLKRAGSDKSKILSAQVWLKDIKKDFAGMNSAWNAWVGSQKPVRATVESPLASPAMLVEIMVTAAK